MKTRVLQPSLDPAAAAGADVEVEEEEEEEDERGGPRQPQLAKLPSRNGTFVQKEKKMFLMTFQIFPH